MCLIYLPSTFPLYANGDACFAILHPAKVDRNYLAVGVGLVRPVDRRHIISIPTHLSSSLSLSHSVVSSGRPCPVSLSVHQSVRRPSSGQVGFNHHHHHHHHHHHYSGPLGQSCHGEFVGFAVVVFIVWMSTPLPPFPHCLSIFVSFSGRCMHAFVAPPPSSIFLSPLVGLSAFAFAFAFALLLFLLFLRLRLRWPRFSYVALPCPPLPCFALLNSFCEEPARFDS
ncbi:hypothetical protein IWZ03DRAFT_97944 [Phyllosticta citriasiana]|uniref:Uncharacterized protein n=1 Tax=Phyllosticta citriasiana TaxID=595635 RepID=A0ABR1KU53_9PEZI